MNTTRSFSGDAKLGLHAGMDDFRIGLPPLTWQPKVTSTEIDAPSVTVADVVVQTMDTARQKEVLCHKSLILCGPPGSGPLPERAS